MVLSHDDGARADVRCPAREIGRRARDFSPPPSSSIISRIGESNSLFRRDFSLFSAPGT
jgi:hypothetical protein